jgi:hypothetical protein
VTDTVHHTTQTTTDAVKKTVGEVGGTVNNVTQNAAGGTPLPPAVATVTDTVDKTVGQVAQGVDQTVDQVTGALDPATHGGG